jgi:hypothetical protein
MFSHIRCVFRAYAEEGSKELPRSFICPFCTGDYRQSLTMNDFSGPGFHIGYDGSPLRGKGTPFI